MKLDDAPRVAAVHSASFEGFFLTFLGTAFLRELYEAFVRDGEIALVAESDGYVIGFVAGSHRPRRLYVRLIRERFWRFAALAAPTLIARPTSITRIVRALLRGSDFPGIDYACLMSIGVDPLAQRRGVGSALVSRFLDECRMRGSRYVTLTTKAEANERTNLFYTQLGFKLSRQIDAGGGRLLNEYEQALPVWTPENGRLA